MSLPGPWDQSAIAAFVSTGLIKDSPADTSTDVTEVGGVSQEELTIYKRRNFYGDSLATLPLLRPEKTRILLAESQPPSQLGNVKPLDEKTEDFLRAMLGYGHKKAGAVLQFFSKSPDGILSRLHKASLYVSPPSSEFAHMVRFGNNTGNLEREVGIDISRYQHADAYAFGVRTPRQPSRGAQ